MTEVAQPVEDLLEIKSQIKEQLNTIAKILAPEWAKGHREMFNAEEIASIAEAQKSLKIAWAHLYFSFDPKHVFHPLDK